MHFFIPRQKSVIKYDAIDLLIEVAYFETPK